MPARAWFTDANGNGYNMNFAEIVRAIRTWYKLRPAQVGIEQGTGHWVRCDFPKPLYVTVKKFQWHTVLDSPVHTPVFYLDYQMRTKPNGSIISEGQLEVRFPADYPKSRPLVRLNDQRYITHGFNASQHLYVGGWMCLATENDWDPTRSTALTAINWAWEWVEMHKSTFGW